MRNRKSESGQGAVEIEDVKSKNRNRENRCHNQNRGIPSQIQNCDSATWNAFDVNKGSR